jgi:hypothetical protein
MVTRGQDAPADPELRDRNQHARQAARLYALAVNVTTATARSHVLALADEHARLAGYDRNDDGSAAAA